MSTVSCTYTHSISLTDRNTGTVFLATPFFSSPVTFSAQLTAPTKEYAAERTTTLGETIDLTSTLTNPFGTALNFSTVYYLFIENTHATQSLTIGGGSSAWSTDVITVPPEGSVSISRNDTVDGTHKNIKILPSYLASQTYKIVIVGT